MQLEPEDLGKCILCGSADAKLIFSGPDRLMGLPGTYSVIRCGECGLARTSPRIPIDERAEYFAPEEGAEAGKNVRIAFYQNRLAARIDKAVKGDTRRVLDVGCGEGVFLELMRSRGWETTGVELGEESSRVAREERGLAVITGDLFSEKLETDCFDAVVMSHVLEHLPEPVTALKHIWTLLKPGGMLMLSLPNYRCLEAKLFREDWYCWALPPHLYHFDAGSVRLALKKTEFSVQRITYLPFFFFVQNLRYALKRDRAIQADQISGERPSGDGFPGRSKPKDIFKTLIFKTILTLSDTAGRIVPGEIMEIEARKETYATTQ